MTEREKLIELLMQQHEKLCDDCMRYPVSETAVFIADYLLANGVKFGNDTDVPGKWIPVSERLPEDIDYVLVCTKNKFYGTRHISKAYFCDGKWYGQGGRWTNVTHWMPLPEPPKEG